MGCEVHNKSQEKLGWQQAGPLLQLHRVHLQGQVRCVGVLLRLLMHMHILCKMRDIGMLVLMY
jgi:hypothetical protein